MTLTELHRLFPRASKIHHDRFRAKCPAHDGKSDASLAVSIGDQGRVLLKCFGGCTLDEIAGALGLAVRDLFEDAPAGSRALRPQARQQRPSAVATPPVDPDKHRRAAAIWKQSSPILGPASDYLMARAGALPPADTDLRWLSDLSLFGIRGPVLVSRISDATDATRSLGLQLTWLHQDGGRWVRGERRYLGGKAGGVVRLWPDEAVTGGLAIAEGVESALAAGHLHPPVWAVLDAGNMAGFPVLFGVESLVIFADNDASGVGQAAAADCADRWLDAGREVTVLMSDTVGADIADEVSA